MEDEELYVYMYTTSGAEQFVHIQNQGVAHDVGLRDVCLDIYFVIAADGHAMSGVRKSMIIYIEIRRMATFTLRGATQFPLQRNNVAASLAADRRFPQ